jgi:hypothetical protein
VQYQSQHALIACTRRFQPVREWGAMKPIVFMLLSLLAASPVWAQKRLVLIDQDGSGPADSNQMAMMVLL